MFSVISLVFDILLYEMSVDKIFSSIHDLAFIILLARHYLVSQILLNCSNPFLFLNVCYQSCYICVPFNKDL
uniref:Uncharacterized protein n=1 Tax=Rhizophora mucronata TaxID=61149 RepID=A0A2P2PBX9_RHIMU